MRAFVHGILMEHLVSLGERKRKTNYGFYARARYQRSTRRMRFKEKSFLDLRLCAKKEIEDILGKK